MMSALTTFRASTKLQAQHDRLWKILSAGLKKQLWQNNPSPLHVTIPPVNALHSSVILFSSQGMKSQLKGVLSPKKKPFAITLHGTFQNGRDGFVEATIILSVKDASPANIEENERSALSFTRMDLLLTLGKQGGRLALLDPRKTPLFWQALVDDLMVHQKKWATKIYAQQKKPEKKPKPFKWPKLPWKSAIFLLILLLLCLFFLA